MSLVTKRKNKTYTSIFLNEVSVAAFREAVELADNLGDYAVVKPSGKAFEQYLATEKPFEKIANAKIGETFTILGVLFKRVESFIDNPSEEFRAISFYDRKNEEVVFGTYINYNSLIEDIFKYHTGRLLFF